MAERSLRPVPLLATGLLLALVVSPVEAGSPAAATAAAASRPPPAEQAAGDSPQLPVNPETDPERTRRSTEEILDGEEYQGPTPENRSFLDRLREWIDRHVDLPRFGRAGSAATDLGAWVVLAVIVAAALAAGTWVLVSSRRRRTAPDDETDSGIDITPLRTSSEWRAEAERCERDGDHRGAVRARFRELTTTLAGRDLLADTPGRTAGEMRLDVAGRAPELSPSFDAVAALFEQVWYRAGPVGPEQSATAHRLADAALRAAPRSPVADPTGEDNG